MTPQFFSQEIEVTTSGEVKAPTAFRLGDKEFAIADIIAAWHDHGFGLTTRRKRWWQRRHRNYYRVKTTGGEVFEIYYDRGTSLKHPEHKKWFLRRQF